MVASASALRATVLYVSKRGLYDNGGSPSKRRLSELRGGSITFSLLLPDSGSSRRSRSAGSGVEIDVPLLREGCAAEHAYEVAFPDEIDLGAIRAASEHDFVGEACSVCNADTVESRSHGGPRWISQR